MTVGTLPTFVGVGASKSGTTSLARWLAEHPDLYVTPQKELRFFTQSWDRGLAWYAGSFAGAAGRPCGEFTPDYLVDAVAIERMAQTVPDAQVLVCLREPVARLLSHYWHRRLRGVETRPLLEAIDAHQDYVDRSDYLPQLLRLTGHWPRERIHVVLFDDIRDQPVEVFAQTCRFLGVDDTCRPEVLGSAFNQAGNFRSNRLRRRMLSSGAFHRAPVLAQRVDRLNRRAVDYPEPSADEIVVLRGRCRYDAPALEAWLGRRLPVAWTSSL